MKKDFVFYNCQRGTHGNCKPKLLLDFAIDCVE